MGRWVMFTWTCRAFAWAGEKILPVLQASMFFMFQTSQRPETPKHRTSGLCHANGRPSSGARFYGFVTFLKLYNSIPIFNSLDRYSECYTWKGSCWSVVSPLVAFGMPSQLLGACGRKAMKGMGEGSATPWAS